MRPMKLGLGLSLMAALAVSGCASETAVQDLLGTGKASAPDASQVTTAQNLSMPPDLQLRAPADAGMNQQASVQPPPQPQQPVAQQQPTTQAAQPLPQPGTQTVASAQPAQQSPEQDLYVKYGISKNYPDGKPKPEWVLGEELYQARAAERRRNNPNFGTIWNIGDLFKDD